jgi:hypothetical protein
VSLDTTHKGPVVRHDAEIIGHRRHAWSINRDKWHSHRRDARAERPMLFRPVSKRCLKGSNEVGRSQQRGLGCAPFQLGPHQEIT